MQLYNDIPNVSLLVVGLYEQHLEYHYKALFETSYVCVYIYIYIYIYMYMCSFQFQNHIYGFETESYRGVPLLSRLVSGFHCNCPGSILFQIKWDSR
jgi:hypothetical protein